MTTIRCHSPMLLRVDIYRGTIKWIYEMHSRIGSHSHSTLDSVLGATFKIRNNKASRHVFWLLRRKLLNDDVQKSLFKPESKNGSQTSNNTL